jgi:hypothetical protein
MAQYPIVSTGLRSKVNAKRFYFRKTTYNYLILNSKLDKIAVLVRALYLKPLNFFDDA